MNAPTEQQNGRRDAAQPALDENVEAIKAWEQASLSARSPAEHFADWLVSTAGSGAVLVLHVLWFGFWVIANEGLIPKIAAFDPFPFPLLSVTVSLEAIFLAFVVLASQSRLSRQSEKRSHLNLQVDLLAERELSAILQLLQDIARQLRVEPSLTADQLRDLAKKTDVETLTSRMEEFSNDSQPATPSPGDSAKPDPR